jgi:hypothetical protein
MKRLLCFASIALSALAISGREAQANLLDYWTFDEMSGEVANDTVGGRNGNWQNAGANLSWTTGIVGGAANLGGQTAGNNYFRVDLAGRLVDATSLTISMWARPDAFTGSTYEGLFTTRGTVTGTAIGNLNWGFSWENGNSQPNPLPHLDSRTGNGLDSTGAMEVGAGANGGWHHVVLVWDGVAGTHTQYLNGVATSAAGPVGTLSGGVWHIGHDDCCGGSRDFDGAVDDLAVWDQALTAQDVADLFARTKGPLDFGAPTDNDGDGMPNDYEDMFPGFLDKDVADADQDVDRVGGVIGGALAPDGLTNAQERQAGTDPRNPDTDGDMLTDADELNVHHTNPLVADTDGDTISDGEEVIEGTDGFVTNPLKKDTDGDTIDDNVEIANGSDPTDRFNPPPPPVPSQGLVALYNFDETSGTTAKDSAITDGVQDAEQNQGAIAWSFTGLIGGALDLDGTSSLLAPDALSAGTSAFSMTAWVQPRAQGGYFGVYATRVVGGAAGTPNFNWGLNVEINPLHGDLRFATGNATTGASAGIDTPNLPLNEWSHLAITWTTDGTEATGKGYLNGALIGTFTTAAQMLNPVYASTGTYNIGDDPCCGGRELNGLIDDVSVWNVALTDQDVLGIYLSGLNGVGIPPSEPVPFRITDFDRNPDGTVTLTWNSHPFPPGTPDLEKPTYTVYYSNDLTTPRGSWADDSDGVVSMGDTTTYTTFSSFTGQPESWFYIQLNTN